MFLVLINWEEAMPPVSVDLHTTGSQGFFICHIRAEGRPQHNDVNWMSFEKPEKNRSLMIKCAWRTTLLHGISNMLLLLF